MTDKLKPCPFCGGFLIKIDKVSYGTNGDSFRVCCHICESGTGTIHGIEAAVTAWNKREKEALPDKIQSKRIHTQLDAVSVEHNGTGKINFENIVVKAKNEYENNKDLRVLTSKQRYVAGVVGKALKDKGYL